MRKGKRHSKTTITVQEKAVGEVFILDALTEFDKKIPSKDILSELVYVRMPRGSLLHSVKDVLEEQRRCGKRFVFVGDTFWRVADDGSAVDKYGLLVDLRTMTLITCVHTDMKLQRRIAR